MIEEFENGVKIVTLGEGTTYISQIFVDGDDVSSGILFSNQPPLNKEFIGNEVIIEITNFKGAISYIKAILGVLESWKIDGLDEEYENFLKTIDKKMVMQKMNTEIEMKMEVNNE